MINQKVNTHGFTYNNKGKQQGFSLLEIFIALSIGLVLFAGVMSVFVGLKTTVSETSSYGEMQENGRFAISVLTDDLIRQGFWGNLPAEMDISVLENPPPVAANDCTIAGTNNGSFPQAVGHFRTIWGATLASASVMNCITDAKTTSDIIVIKRVISQPVLPPVTAGKLDANRYYLMSSANSADVFAGNAAIPTIPNSQVWEYQNHIYYIKNETQGSNIIPVLMQGRLTNSATKAINFQPMIDGIEMIRFWYGVDMDADVDTNDYTDTFNASSGPGDGVIDAFIPARNMTAALWDNDASKILAVKVFVLVRDILPDAKYTNNNTYQLGGSSTADQFSANGDNYRRLLFSSTVSLQNVKVKVWN